MATTPSDPIFGPPRGTPNEAFENLPAGDPNFNPTMVRCAIDAYYREAPMVGIDPLVLIAQASEETRKFLSDYAQIGNFAGIGIWKSGVESPFDMSRHSSCDRGDLGARIHIAAILVRAKVMHPGDLPNNLKVILDVPGVYDYLERVYHVFDDNRVSIKTIDDLNKRFGPDNRECAWSCDPDYQDKIIEHANALFPTVAKETQMLTNPTFIIVAGHNAQGDQGNPNERALTSPLASEIARQLKAAGYKVVRIADGNPGGLDGVSRELLTTGQNTVGDLVILDIHFEGASAPGVFSIYPRSDGLGTAIPVGGQANDAQGNNPLDEEYGLALAASIAKATGLGLRQSGVVKPGLMGEHQTGVAGQYGARLATFAYTAPLQPRAIRLVVENGSLPTSDGNVIRATGFNARAAGAYVATAKKYFPLEKVLTPAKFPAFDGKDHGDFRAIKRKVTAGKNGATRRTHGTSDSKHFAGKYNAGDSINVIYKAGRYWVDESGWRVYQGDVVEKVSFS